MNSMRHSYFHPIEFQISWHFFQCNIITYFSQLSVFMCVKSAHLSKRKREMKTEKEGEIKHELCHFQNNKVQSCVRYIWSSKAISNSLFPIAPAVTWLLFVGEKMTTKTTHAQSSQARRWLWVSGLFKRSGEDCWFLVLVTMLFG